MTKKTIKQSKGIRKQTRENTLCNLDMQFIINYDGDAKNAAIAAGIPEVSADKVAQRILSKPLVIEAILRRNEAALKVIEGEGKKAAVTFAKHGVTIELIARTIKKVLDSPSHEKSGYAAHAKMADLASNILGLKTSGGMKIPPGSTGGVQQGEFTDAEGRRFFMYRAAWVKDPDELTTPSHQRLQASNG